MEKQSLFKKIFLGKRKYIIVALVIALISTVMILINKNRNDQTGVVSAVRGNLNQEVLVSGVVKPMESVELAFEKNGTVSWINKEVGDKVKAGEVIATLENGAEQATLENAQAQLKSENARYQELSLGSRQEEIGIKESELAKAKQDLASYYSDAINIISDAYNKADNAINKQTDAIFSNDQTSNPDLTFNVNNQQVKNDAVAERSSITNTLKKLASLNDEFLSSEKTGEEKELALQNARLFLLKIQGFLIKVSTALDNATNLSETTLSSYKDNVSTGRTNIITAIQSVSKIIDDIASQKITVEKTARELELKKIGSTPEVLSQQASAIMKAKASVKSAESGLRKTVIRSPINGVITKQDTKIGEIASQGKNLISVMSDNNFKIEANIAEVDLVKLKIGNRATVTIDAYGDETNFDATIISIDPAEKIIDGVATYKTTLSLDNPTKPVRSGMTANIKIKTEEKLNVLILPIKAIMTKNGKRTVTISTPDGNIEQEIVTGLRGANGMVEILSGLKEGTRVVLPNGKN